MSTLGCAGEVMLRGRANHDEALRRPVGRTHGLKANELGGRSRAHYDRAPGLMMSPRAAFMSTSAQSGRSAHHLQLEERSICPSSSATAINGELLS